MHIKPGSSTCKHNSRLQNVQKSLRVPPLQAQQQLAVTTTAICMVCLGVQDLRDEYVRHFQNQDFVVGRKYEAQLSKTLLPRISAADLQKLADRFKPSSSCTVKAISHNRYTPQSHLTKLENQLRQGQITQKGTTITPRDSTQELLLV